MNDNLTSTIQGTNSGTIEIQGIAYNLTVTVMERFVVQSEELNFDLFLHFTCSCNTYSQTQLVPLVVRLLKLVLVVV